MGAAFCLAVHVFKLMEPAMKRLLICTCLAAAVLPATAHADTMVRGPAFQAEIPAADLDLTTAEGKKALFVRARKVAQQVCAPDAFPRNYQAKSLRACTKTFEQAALDAVSRAKS
jgi:UrcA family protein